MTSMPRRSLVLALAGLATAGWLLAPSESPSPVAPPAAPVRVVPARKPAIIPKSAPSDVRRLGTVPSEQAWNTG